MKYLKLLILSLSILPAVPAFGQMSQPVSWKAEAVRLEGNTYEIRATGTMTPISPLKYTRVSTMYLRWK